MKVRELMQSQPVTVGEDTLAKDAYETMRSQRFRHLPVVDKQNRLVGMVSDRDILNVAVMLEKRPDGPGEYLIGDDVKIRSIMTAEPTTVSPDDNVSQVVDVMLGLTISGLPVVDNRKLVGIVTNTDLLRLLRKLSDNL